ncbi:MAG: MBL fold metallo-hydrolase [Burkholderiales bacterium]|nr:MBL fold metallo-hydrolase [Burkholderiales bacterium]
MRSGGGCLAEPGRARGGATRARAVLAAVLVLAGCATPGNPYYDTAKAHHTPQGFRNNYLAELGNGGANFWKWQWERLRDGLPKQPANGYGFPVAAPDVAWLRANRSRTAATWIGHATVLLQVAGVNILTDPHITDRASPVSFAGPKRFVRPALDFDQLPHIDMVVISHNHYDHLDERTVLTLSRQPGGSPRFFVPLGNKAWFAELGITDVVELDWWDRRDFKGLEVHFTPVQHWSARGLDDRFRTLWGGWYVRAPGFRAFFAGDTGYSKDFADIRARLGPVDFAMLPVGAYEPRWFMRAQHIDPAEAVRIHRDMGARHTLGIHWGTFELTDEPLDEPPRRLDEELARAGIDRRAFRVVRHGETWLLDGGPAVAAR